MITVSYNHVRTTKLTAELCLNHQILLSIIRIDKNHVNSRALTKAILVNFLHSFVHIRSLQVLTMILLT